MTTGSTPYRPSNGTEGESFYAQWCQRCERERAYRESGYDDPDLACPIVTSAMALKITNPDYPREWIKDADGPHCSAFTTDPLNPTRCDRTADMFAGATEKESAS